MNINYGRESKAIFLALILLTQFGALRVVGFDTNWSCPTTDINGSPLTCDDITSYHLYVDPPKTEEVVFSMDGGIQQFKAVLPKEHGTYNLAITSCINNSCSVRSDSINLFINNLQAPTDGFLDAPTEGSIE